MIAHNGYTKAVELFNMNTIYEYIYELTSYLSTKNVITDKLDKTIMITPGINHYFKNRLNIINNSFSFTFSGKDIELAIYNNTINNKLTIKYTNTIITILLNNNVLLNQKMPILLNEKILHNT